MIKAIKDFYKWSPVIANTLLAGVIVLIFVAIKALGGPEVNFTALLAALGVGQIFPTYKSVTPNSKVPDQEPPVV